MTQEERRYEKTYGKGLRPNPLSSDYYATITKEDLREIRTHSIDTLFSKARLRQATGHMNLEDIYKLMYKEADDERQDILWETGTDKPVPDWHRDPLHGYCVLTDLFSYAQTLKEYINQ